MRLTENAAHFKPRARSPQGYIRTAFRLLQPNPGGIYPKIANRGIIMQNFPSVDDSTSNPTIQKKVW